MLCWYNINKTFLLADDTVEHKKVIVVINKEDKSMYLYIGLGIIFITLIGFLMTRRKKEI